MKVAVLVPRREDHGRRDEIWAWVKGWMRAHHPDWPIYEGRDDDGEVFSMAKARNDAARMAGDWDVGLIMDADTVGPPDVVEDAVRRARHSLNLVVAGDTRMCMDVDSSDRIMRQGVWFPRPDGCLPKTGTGASDSIYGEPSSGVMAISRRLWDATGGYVESLAGWGYEDLVFLAQANLFGDGVMWMPRGILLHFWHPRSRLTDDTDRNHRVWQEIGALACHANARDLVRDYLADQLGHTWP